MWGPPVISWFISPGSYSYLRTINHSYWSYVHKLSYRLRGPHIVPTQTSLRFRLDPADQRLGKRSMEWVPLLTIIPGFGRSEVVIIYPYIYLYIWVYKIYILLLLLLLLLRSLPETQRTKWPELTSPPSHWVVAGGPWSPPTKHAGWLISMGQSQRQMDEKWGEI